MCIIEGNKIIFKSCFFQAFEGNTRCIDTQCRCTCMSRNTFGIDGQSSLFFGYFIFLQFCLGKCCFQSFFQSLFCRDHGITGVADRIYHKSAVHGNDLCVFGICHHMNAAFFSMDTWIACIRCETTGQFFCNLIIVFHTFGTGFLVASHDQTDTFI